jgi:hypothetical protein
VTTKVTLAALGGVVALWFALLWLALRQPGRGTRNTEHDEARDS